LSSIPTKTTIFFILTCLFFNLPHAFGVQALGHLLFLLLLFKLAHAEQLIEIRRRRVILHLPDPLHHRVCVTRLEQILAITKRVHLEHALSLRIIVRHLDYGMLQIDGIRVRGGYHNVVLLLLTQEQGATLLQHCPRGSPRPVTRSLTVLRHNLTVEHTLLNRLQQRGQEVVRSDYVLALDRLQHHGCLLAKKVLQLLDARVARVLRRAAHHLLLLLWLHDLVLVHVLGLLSHLHHLVARLLVLAVSRQVGQAAHVVRVLVGGRGRGVLSLWPGHVQWRRGDRVDVTQGGRVGVLVRVVLGLLLLRLEEAGVGGGRGSGLGVSGVGGVHVVEVVLLLLLFLEEPLLADDGGRGRVVVGVAQLLGGVARVA